MNNMAYFERLGVPFKERPGHTAECSRFEDLYPWQCDCHVKSTEYASEVCRECNGDGKTEHPHLMSAYAGITSESPADPVLVDCVQCCGTGEITSDEHDAFKFDHGIDVYFRGGKQVVFFDYEGDGIFVWAFPYDTETDGQQCTAVERQSIYEQLNAWFRDWTASSPEDDRCE